MKRFVARYSPYVTGVLSGFDRLVFRGHLLQLIRSGGMYIFLEAARVRLLDFKKFVTGVTNRVKEAALDEARRLERPVHYLESPKTDKEDFAKMVLKDNPVDQGLICVLTALEPCMTFEYHKSKDRNERGLRLRPGKCLHLYKYMLHPRFGFMHARLQTWFPFNVQIYINGREWLGQRLQQKGIEFARADNCFTYLQDPRAAQRLMSQQLRTKWPWALDRIARQLNPIHREVFEHMPMDYYWSAYQTEWATDVMFASPHSLSQVYPDLVRHAMFHFQSPDVMRFLGRKANGNFLGEIETSFKDRAEGVRVKHWVNGNSVKMYDKAGSVLRVETTIGNTKDFKVLRPPPDDPDGPLEWRPLRKGVADLHRRAQVSQRSNEAYYDALSAATDSTPAAEVFDPVCRPTKYRGRRVRALRLGDASDLALLKAICRGEFCTSGFRNRDLRAILFPESRIASKEDVRRFSARVSRLLRILRAHGVIKKLPKSHRYRLTTSGNRLTAALFAARAASIEELTAKAA
jgi:hypothetical protein